MGTHPAWVVVRIECALRGAKKKRTLDEGALFGMAGWASFEQSLVVVDLATASVSPQHVCRDQRSHDSGEHSESHGQSPLDKTAPTTNSTTVTAISVA
ncbi:hypothetical protein NLO73_25755, partial [Escherichia coli]|nr:hypothetical protein [Escherichia coli]